MISVVVPLHNCENYIERCVNSILNQTYEDFELLIVNDGSTDRSLELVNKYNDKRIRLFNQDNKGPSAARNIGLENANGEYIMFLDGDDEYEPFFIEEMYKGIKKFKTDLAIGLCRRKNKKWITEPQYYKNHNIVLKAKEFIYDEQTPPPCICIFQSLSIKNVRFDENIKFSEDWLYMKEALLNAESIVFLNIPGYLYWDNEVDSLAWGSFNYEKHIEKAHANVYSHVKLYSILWSRKLDGSMFINQAFNILFAYYYFLFSVNAKNYKVDLLREIKYIKPFLWKLTFCRRVKYFFFVFFPFLTFRVFRLFNKTLCFFKEKK